MRWRAIAPPLAFGWQANRLAPAEVLRASWATRSSMPIIVRSPDRSPFGVGGTTEATFVGVHRSHWWLVAFVA